MSGLGALGGLEEPAVVGAVSSGAGRGQPGSNRVVPVPALDLDAPFAHLEHIAAEERLLPAMRGCSSKHASACPALRELETDQVAVRQARSHLNDKIWVRVKPALEMSEVPVTADDHAQRQLVIFEVRRDARRHGSEITRVPRRDEP